MEGIDYFDPCVPRCDYETGAFEVTRDDERIVAIDGLPVYRAPNRSVARRLRKLGFTYDTWRCRFWEPGWRGEFRVRGWH